MCWSNKIKLSIIFTISTLFLTLSCCPSSNYLWVKVNKSAFIPDSVEVNIDGLIEGGIKICTAGQRYYKKSSVQGGGNNSFDGFYIPARLMISKYGSYVMFVKNNMIKVIGTGRKTGYDGHNKTTVELVATENYITLSMVN